MYGGRYSGRGFLLVLICFVIAGCSSPEKSYYAIEYAGVPLGYIETWSVPGDSVAGEPTVQRGRMHNRMTLLGKSVDVVVESSSGVDPRTGETLYCDMWVRSGGARIGSHCTVSGDTVFYATKPDGETKTIVLDPDVHVGDGFDFAYLFPVEPGGKPFMRRSFDVFRGNVHTTRYAPVDAETLLVANHAYDCFVFDAYNETLGAGSRMWIERGTGRLVRQESADATSMTISDASVKGRVKRANMDDMILAGVDVDIEDVRAITWMKVRAKIRTAGQRVTAESLNLPGQQFTGTVENNFVDGTFEIRHERYDGADAPPFPPAVADGIAVYLEPELAIESGDPAIRDKAIALTRESTDSWDAVKRIATFVATEIEGDIPGGGTALGTLESGKAECGGHSRLFAALCRSVGIPARCVMGCMYFTGDGAWFGQHMWNEVHMGAVGWIPIDATAREVDYVDSGHIRLGMLSSFNPVEMDILDYEVGPHVPDPMEDRGDR